MDVEASRGPLRFLGDVEDPRMSRTRLHARVDILFPAPCAVIRGADRRTEAELFGKSKPRRLRRYVPLANGIPSHDTPGRVFARLKPGQLECRFMKRMKALADAAAVLLQSELEKPAVWVTPVEAYRTEDRPMSRERLLTAWAGLRTMVAGFCTLARIT